MALRVAVAVAVLAATSATLAQGVGGGGLRVAATAGIAAGFVYSHRARARPGYALKALLALGAMAAFASFLRSVSGLGIGTFGEVQVPLAELFLWVQVLHSADVPARRDLQFSLLSSLVLMAVAAALSRSTGLGLHLLVWLGAAVASLVLAHRSELAELPGLGRPGRSGAPGPVRLWRPVVAVLVLVAAVGAGVLAVVPVGGAGQAVAFPTRLPERIGLGSDGALSNPSLGAEETGGAGPERGRARRPFGYFGFAPSLDTAVRGRPDRTLVMKVRAARPDFWRGQSFDRWDGRRWTQTDQRPAPVGGPAPIQVGGGPEERAVGVRGGGSDLVQTFFVEKPGPNLIFAAYAPAEVYFGDRRLFELSDGTLRTGVELPGGSVYSVVSRRPAVTVERLRAAAAGLQADDPHAIQQVYRRYAELPAVPARVADLARQATAGAPTTYDKVRALEAWMAAHTTYTLDVPPLPPGADAVEQFLFVDRRGFCEQIGSALVVMLRTLGIPARLAVGYTPGERNPFTGLWEVQADDAHAWAEVWFPGLGWQAFDPTAQVPLAGDAFSTTAGRPLLDWVAARLPRLPRLPERWPRVAAALLGGALPLASAAGLAGRRFAAGRRERSRPWADRLLERLERAGARRGRPRAPAESPRRYARALAGSVLPDDRLVVVGQAVEADAFGPRRLDPARREEVESLLQEVEAAQPVAGRTGWAARVSNPAPWD